MVLSLLAAVWVAFLLPPYLRKRHDRRSDSISSFRLHLLTLARTAPGAASSVRLVPELNAASASPARSLGAIPFGRPGIRRRRCDVLCTLAGAAALTLVLALVLGGIAIVVHIGVDVLLLGYINLLVRMRKAAADRALKVRYLPAPGLAQEPALFLRRSASN